jgi:hypothetical protein
MAAGDRRFKHLILFAFGPGADEAATALDRLNLGLLL